MILYLSFFASSAKPALDIRNKLKTNATPDSFVVARSILMVALPVFRYGSRAAGLAQQLSFRWGVPLGATLEGIAKIRSYSEIQLGDVLAKPRLKAIP
jgi:hypothetical protein